MINEESLTALRQALSQISASDMEEYLKSREFSDFEKNQFAAQYMYRTSKGNSYGMMALLKTILEFMPIDAIPEPTLRERIVESGVQDKLNAEKISRFQKDTEQLAALATDAARREKDLEEAISRKRSAQGKLEDIKCRVEELEKLLADLDTGSMSLDAASQARLDELMDSKIILENYEKFLSSIVKARKFTLPKKGPLGTQESKDGEILHEFLLLKWYLNEYDPEFEDEAFEKKYKELLGRFKALSKEGKEFFGRYMDSTRRPGEGPD